MTLEPGCRFSGDRRNEAPWNITYGREQYQRYTDKPLQLWKRVFTNNHWAVSKRNKYRIKELLDENYEFIVSKVDRDPLTFI